MKIMVEDNGVGKIKKEIFEATDEKIDEILKMHEASSPGEFDKPCCYIQTTPIPIQKEKLKRNDIVFIPLGSTEAHGNHSVQAQDLLHVAKARLLGAGEIIAIDASSSKLDLAKEFGADYTINVSKTTTKERIDIVKDLTEGRGADVVVECVGIPDVVPERLEMLRQGGTSVETGNFSERGSTQIDIHRHIAAKNVLIIGNTNHPHTGYYSAIKMLMKYADVFPFEKLITDVYKLEAAETAITRSPEPNSLKVLFTP